MTDTTNAKADTSAGDGKKLNGKDEGAGTDPAKTQDDEKQFTKAELEFQVKERLRRQQEVFEKKQAEEKRIAEDAKAKEQGEFQKLAENRGKELDELKPKYEAATQELEAYRSKVAEMAAAKLKALPDEVRDIAPAVFGEDKSLTNPLDVLTWLPKGEALAEKLEGSTGKTGIGRDPKPIAGTPKQAFEHSRTQLVNSGKYGF